MYRQVSSSQQSVSYIRQEQVTFNDVMVVICFALEKHTKLNIVVVSHWSNNPQVEMSIQFGHWSKDTGNEDKQNYKKPITHKVKKMNNTDPYTLMPAKSTQILLHYLTFGIRFLYLSLIEVWDPYPFGVPSEWNWQPCSWLNIMN